MAEGDSKMPKKLNGWYKTAIYIAITVFGIGVAWATLKGNSDANSKGIEHLKVEGCAPAQGHSIDIAVVQANQRQMNKNIDDIKTEQKEIRTEQQAAAKEILKAIRENN